MYLINPPLQKSSKILSWGSQFVNFTLLNQYTDAHNDEVNKSLIIIHPFQTGPFFSM